MFECLLLNMQRIYLKFVYQFDTIESNQIESNQIPLSQQSVCFHKELFVKK